MKMYQDRYVLFKLYSIMTPYLFIAQDMRFKENLIE